MLPVSDFLFYSNHISIFYMREYYKLVNDFHNCSSRIETFLVVFRRVAYLRSTKSPLYRVLCQKGDEHSVSILRIYHVAPNSEASLSSLIACRIYIISSKIGSETVKNHCYQSGHRPSPVLNGIVLSSACSKGGTWTLSSNSLWKITRLQEDQTLEELDPMVCNMQGQIRGNVIHHKKHWCHLRIKQWHKDSVEYAILKQDYNESTISLFLPLFFFI